MTDTFILLVAFALTSTVALLAVMLYYGQYWYEKLLSWERRLAAETGQRPDNVSLLNPPQYAQPTRRVVTKHAPAAGPSMGNGDDPEQASDKSDEIIRLIEAGESNTAIANAVYGYANGRTLDEVKGIRQSYNDHDNQRDTHDGDHDKTMTPMTNTTQENDK